MYYILYEGLKIESNEPVYCTVYSVRIGVRRTVYIVQSYTIDIKKEIKKPVFISIPIIHKRDHVTYLSSTHVTYTSTAHVTFIPCTT